MTTCSTVLALGMMPLLLYVYCQGFSNLQNAVPYVDIVVALILILIPCAGGILINHYKPKYANIVNKVGLSVLALVVVVILVISSVSIGRSILAVFAPPLMAIGALIPFIGYAFGYIISSIFRLTHSERRTIAMETGCQNVQLASTVLKMGFPPEAVGPLFLFPFVYASLQLMEAAVLILLFRGYQLFKFIQKRRYQSTNTTAECEETELHA